MMDAEFRQGIDSALATTGMAPTVPASPAPLTPRRLVAGDGGVNGTYSCMRVTRAQNVPEGRAAKHSIVYVADPAADKPRVFEARHPADRFRIFPQPTSRADANRGTRRE
jgi:hypothetical protein